MNKLICQKCGQQIQNDFGVTLFHCTNCGAGIQSLPMEKPAPFGQIPALVSPKPKSNSKIARNVLGGLGVILLSALGIFGYWFLSEKHPLAKWKTNYFELDAALTTAEAIKEKIGGDFNVVEITIQPKEFSMIIQNKDNPNYVDVIKSNSLGIIIGPDVVKTPTQSGNIPQSSFPFKDINFSAIPSFTQEAIAKANIEGAKVTKLILGRGFISKIGSPMGNYGEIRWKIEIEGTREMVTATASPQGKLLSVDISRTSQAANYTVITNEELQKAQNSIIETLGKDTQISRIIIYDNYINFAVPYPENPEKVNIYSFGINGLAQKEFGSHLSSYNPIRPMSFSEIRLADAVQLLEKAKVRSGLANGKVSLISVGKYIATQTSPHQPPIALAEWEIRLKDGEKDASVEFDLKGNIIEKKLEYDVK
jgi:hypothetical protein